MLVVELGIPLYKPYRYYKKILKKNNLKCIFKCKTNDIYYTNINLNNKTEKEIKDSCIRIRKVNNKEYKIENNLIKEFNIKTFNKNKLNEIEKELNKYGFKKLFNTTKKDYHWFKEGMTSRIQLQKIKNIGLLLYYDNEKYYNLNLEEQRKSLIDELNSYGFNFEYDTLGLDKLRTLYYKENKYSNNQNA